MSYETPLLPRRVRLRYSSGLPGVGLDCLLMKRFLPSLRFACFIVWTLIWATSANLDTNKYPLLAFLFGVILALTGYVISSSFTSRNDEGP